MPIEDPFNMIFFYERGNDCNQKHAVDLFAKVYSLNDKHNTQTNL